MSNKINILLLFFISFYRIYYFQYHNRFAGISTATIIVLVIGVAGICAVVFTAVVVVAVVTLAVEYKVLFIVIFYDRSLFVGVMSLKTFFFSVYENVFTVIVSW